MKDFINKILDGILGLPVVYRSVLLSLVIVASVITYKIHLDYKLEVVRITGKNVSQPKDNDFVDDKSGRGIGIIQVDEPKEIAKSVNEP